MIEETYRELWKRGQTVFDKTVQGKIVSEEEYEQKELICYNFRVDDFSDLSEMLDLARKNFNYKHLHINVAKEWLKDMTTNNTLTEKWWNMTDYSNKYFKEFCEEANGKASYSYGERIIPQLDGLYKRLESNKYSRGALISLNINDDINRIGRRIPCTNSYHFIARPTIDGDKLNLIVFQRSSDAINFFPLDFAKAVLFLKFVCEKVNMNPGFVSMIINSLHLYKKDVINIYKW